MKVNKIIWIFEKERIPMKKQALLVGMVAGLLVWPGAAKAAYFPNFDTYQLSIQKTEDTLTLQRDVHSDYVQRDEIIRGQDLRWKVEEMMAKLREAMYSLKMRLVDLKNRAQEDTKLRMMNVQDMMQRNKDKQDFNEMIQQDRLRMAKDMNETLKQRIKDRTRR
jgi:hypothetical protein